MLAALIVDLHTGVAQVEGVLITREGREIRGILQWKGAQGVYEIQQPGSSATTTLTADKVKRVMTRPPPELEEAKRNVQSGRHLDAIPVLKRIASLYIRLEHDVVATRWLAEAYQKSGDLKSAVAVCEKLMKENPACMASEEFVSVYGDKLILDKQYVKAKDIFTRIIEQGDHAAAAVAQIKRADMDMANGNVKEALVNGYLRTALLFGDVKQLQPEALYKAALCFEKLGQTPEAEKMRRQLLADYPQDPFAAKARSSTPAGATP